MTITDKPKWAIKFYGSEWEMEIHVHANEIHRDKKNKSVCWADGVRIEIPNNYNENIISISRVDYLLNEE